MSKFKFYVGQCQLSLVEKRCVMSLDGFMKDIRTWK